MKVVILCGGFGTRLREETEYRPKPMIKIGEKPILWHIMKIFSHHGFNEFVLCLGYKGDQIKEYFYNYEILNNDCTIELGKQHRMDIHGEHAETGWRITLVDTGKASMTGARVKRISRYIDEDRFMLTYGDGVADIDVRKLLDFHASHGRIGTVTGVHPSSRFGELLLDGKRVRAFSEKPQVTDTHINGGFFVFERSFLDYLDSDESCVLEVEPLERLAREGEFMTYKHDGFWHCMDTYRDFKILNDLWSSGKAPWCVWKQKDESSPSV